MEQCARFSSVLFVCTGNICRSPTAEAVFKNRIKHINPSYDALIDSAGIQGYHVGEAPDHRSIAVAKENGVSMEGLTARKVIRSDFERFDHIIAMDQGHLNALKAMAEPKDRAEISLLLDHHLDFKGQDVPDPYYGTRRDFEHTYRLIEAGIEGFIGNLSGSGRK